MADMQIEARVEFSADTAAAESGVKAVGDAAKESAAGMESAGEKARGAGSEMDNLGDKADDAAKRTDDLGKKAKGAGQSGADGMNLMGTATAAMQGNLAGVVTGVANLTGRVKLLGMSMMQLSLVGAVLTGLVKLFQAISDHSQRMAQNLRAIQAGNVAAAVDRITASYSKMREETERAQKSRDALFDVNMRELDAVKNMEIAQIALNKQRELGSARTDAERAAIEAKYKLQEMDRSKLSDDAAAGFRRELLGAKAAESDQQAQRDMAEIEELRGQLAKRQQQTSYARGEASRLAQGSGISHALSGGSRLKRAEGMQQEADSGHAEVVSLIKQIEALQKAVEDNTEAAAIYRKEQDVAGIEIKTSGIRDQTDRTALANDERMRSERDRAAAERQRREDALDALEQRKAALEASRAETQARLQARAQAEQREAAAAAAAASGSRGKAGYGQANAAAGKENREAQAAAREVANYAAETSRTVKGLAAEMKKLRDDMKAATRNIPNS